jgi:hypothetical protein
MAQQTAALVARLRTGLNVALADAAQQALYEHWIGQERWPLDPVALALLVGIAPAQWHAHLDRHKLVADAAQLRTLLQNELTLDADLTTNGLAVRAFAQRHGVTLPAAAESLLDFVARTLPRLAAEIPVVAAAPARSSDKELVLGAALALVTRFTEDCLDDERMFDSARIAQLMLAQAALWFPDGPPRMDERAIAALVEHYISGF